MKQLLYRYNPWWTDGWKPEKTFLRPDAFADMTKNLDNKQIVFVTGLRRIGKTTLLKQTITHLIEHRKITPSQILYVSMDDYLLADASILSILEAFRQIQSLSFDTPVYLFLDEITYQKNYEQQLKNLYDSQNTKIYASSSSASILKSKKHFLTGRNIVLEVLPLDFTEYLLFKGTSIKPANAHLNEKYFEDFLKTGGIPEYVLSGNIEYLKELVDDIIKKDIAAYHGIKDTQVLQDFFLLLMERSGKVMSINKMAHILEIAPDTAKRYLQIFADSYLIYLVPRFGKTNERLLSAKKIYAADLGIRTYFTGFRDKGSLFENYVFLKIKKLSPSYFYQQGHEIDFIINKKILIEVKYNSEMTDKQKLLYDQTTAEKKLLIKNISDLPLLENLLS